MTIASSLRSFTIVGCLSLAAGSAFAQCGAYQELVAGYNGAKGDVVLNVGSCHPCPADFNHSGALEVQDIFDFLGAWFAGLPSANFNGGILSVQDIFDFLASWFGGC